MGTTSARGLPRPILSSWFSPLCNNCASRRNDDPGDRVGLCAASAKGSLGIVTLFYKIAVLPTGPRWPGAAVFISRKRPE